MKEKDILKGLRERLDKEMKVRGFVFDSKKGDYVKSDLAKLLYFRISFLFLDFVVPGSINHSKYLEIFLNVYHTETSTLLWKNTVRGKNLDSYFFFKIVGNMLSDIVLNPDWTSYTKRNNHNFFRLIFTSEDDMVVKSEQILSLVEEYAIPFFDKLDNIDKIKAALDCCYSEWIPIHNINHERLLVLVVLLYKANDDLKEEKTKMIKDYFMSVNNYEALSALDQILQSLPK